MPAGCWLLVSGWSAVRSHAVWRRRVAQGWADQGPRLFERSEFEQDPDQTEQRSVPRSAEKGATTSARLFLLTSFGEAKEVSRLPGRLPGQGRLWCHQRLKNLPEKSTVSAGINCAGSYQFESGCLSGLGGQSRSANWQIGRNRRRRVQFGFTSLAPPGGSPSLGGLVLPVWVLRRSWCLGEHLEIQMCFGSQQV